MSIEPLDGLGRPDCPKCGRSRLEELVIESQRADDEMPVGRTRQWRCWWCMHRWDRDEEASA